MQIILNGEAKDLEKIDVITVDKLLEYFDISREGTVVLINEEILTKENYNTEIYEGFKIEILRFVSGG
ncbi:MAG: sulfur carrier protein ThiS [Fusobacteriaceae bacterium]